MKSGLRDRNNVAVNEDGTFVINVSMKSGLRDRNNYGNVRYRVPQKGSLNEVRS